MKLLLIEAIKENTKQKNHFGKKSWKRTLQKESKEKMKKGIMKLRIYGNCRKRPSCNFGSSRKRPSCNFGSSRKRPSCNFGSSRNALLAILVVVGNTFLAILEDKQRSQRFADKNRDRVISERDYRDLSEKKSKWSPRITRDFFS